MNKISRLVLLAIFTGLAGFLLGILFLFIINVPLEHLLVKLGAIQWMIDYVMRLIILLWAISTFAMAFWYYRISSELPLKSHLRTNGILTIVAALIFFGLILTDNTPINVFRGQVVEINNGFTIGPYPDELKLKELKENGYHGIITLLNPAIPFEKVLLERELKAAEKIGLKVYSYPMFPWISSNKDSLDSIGQLVSEGSRTYYIHCYLGKHRVDLVRQRLESEQGQNNIQSFIFPAELERGPVYYYKNGQIILGPYPTDEEWFSFILRSQVKGVISLLDYENPDEVKWLEKERQICQDMGLTLKVVPLKKPEELDKLVAELSKSAEDNKLFIHSFKQDRRFAFVDGYLRTGALVNRTQPLPEHFAQGPIFEVTPQLVLGPLPTQQETELLKSLGIALRQIPLGQEGQLPLAANKVLDMLSLGEGAVYFYGLTTALETEQLANIIKNRFYGIKMEQLTELERDNIELMEGRLIIGPVPDEGAMNHLALAGVNTLIYITGRTENDEDILAKLTKETRKQGFNLITLRYGELYEDKIVKEYFKDNNLAYIMGPGQSLHQIKQDLRARFIY